MKIVIIFTLVVLCFFPNKTFADSGATELSLSFSGTSYDSIVKLNKGEMRFGINYNVKDNTTGDASIAKSEIKNDDLENKSSIFRKNETLSQHRRSLAVGLNYNYNGDGTSDLSFLTKERNIGQNFMSINITPNPKGTKTSLFLNFSF